MIEKLNAKYVTVAWTNIRYIAKGVSPSVLFVHGFGEFLEVWSLTIAALSKYFTVYALDLPGHGQSEETPVNYTLGFGTK